ncbi:MAG TPA: glycosyltransferase family 39 protein, partial [Acidobacteriota bacterium]
MKSVRDLSFYFWIFLIFIASQITAALLNIRFVGSSQMIIEPFWQYLDPQILKTELVRGLFFLHSQPPLFNAFLGVVLKLFPQSYEQVFAWIFRAISLGTLLLMGFIMRRMALNEKLIFVFCAIFALFSNFLVYTNLLFYTLPVAFLLLLSCLFLQMFLETQKTEYAVLFTSTAGIIMLTRSIYHLIWFLLCGIVIFFLIDHNRRRIFLRAAIIPIFLVILLYAKNSALVGSFGPSSWMGMNLARGWQLPT